MIAMLLVGNRIDECLEISAELIRNNINRINLASENKIIILNAIKKLENEEKPSILENESFEKLSEVVCDVVCYDDFRNLIASIDEVNGIQEQVHRSLATVIGDVSTELELASTQCIVRKLVGENQDKVEIYEKWRDYAVEKRKKVN
jgi:L-asparaginase II